MYAPGESSPNCPMQPSHPARYPLNPNPSGAPDRETCPFRSVIKSSHKPGLPSKNQSAPITLSIKRAADHTTKCNPSIPNLSVTFRSSHTHAVHSEHLPVRKDKVLIIVTVATGTAVTVDVRPVQIKDIRLSIVCRCT